MPKAPDKDKFIERLATKAPNWELVGDYNGSVAKNTFRCKKCGGTVELYATNILTTGGVCPHCELLKKKAEFDEKLKEQFNGKYICKEFNGIKKDAIFVHTVCGGEFKLTPERMLKVNHCPVCSPYNKKKTKDDFEEMLRENGDEFECLEFTSMNSDAKLRHKGCGAEFNVISKQFIKTFRCPVCNSYRKEILKGDFDKLLKEHGSRFKCITYNGYTHTGVFKCLDCEGIFETVPKSVLSLKNCPVCSPYNTPITKEEFLKRLADSKAHFELVGEFKGMRVRTTFRCTKCNSIIERLPMWIISGAHCPNCEADEYEWGSDKMTREEFLEKAKVKNPTFKLIGEFIDADTPIEFLHLSCGSSVFQTPRSILKGNGRCSKCKSVEIQRQFENNLEEKSNGSLICLEYNGYKTAAKFVHLDCGRKFFATPCNIINTLHCPSCDKYPYKMSKDEFKNLLTETDPRFSLIGEFNGVKTLTRFRCNECGKEFDAVPKNVLTGEYVCRVCKVIANGEEYKEKLEKRYPGKFTVLSYINSMFPISVKCNECGGVFTVNPYGLLAKGYCQRCGDSHTLTKEEFEERLNKIHRDRYTLVGKYTILSVKTKFRCNKCNLEWDALPKNLLLGHGCPHCNESKGEMAIRTYLQDHNIPFIAQYKFNDCKNAKSLPFDFAILNNDGSVKVLVEFDGLQHYEPIDGFGGMDSFEKTQTNDAIKNEFCDNNGYNLIRIPYWDFDYIDDILRDCLAVL